MRRAKAHRDALEEHINSTFEDSAKRPVLGIRHDAAAGEDVLYIAAMPDLSVFLENVALSVGDIVNNLRGALDHLAWQPALHHTNGSIAYPRRVQFPIVDNQTSVFGSDALGEVDPAHKTLIEAYQPYHGTAGRPDSWSGPYVHQLTLLRDMSNTDKHRVLNTILTVPTHMQFSERSVIPMLLSKIAELHTRRSPTRNAGDQLEVGTEVMRTRPMPGRDSRRDLASVGLVTPQIALSERRSVIATVDRIARFVQLIVSEFEAITQDIMTTRIKHRLRPASQRSKPISRRL